MQGWILWCLVMLHSEACQVFCDGDLLAVIQSSRIYEDSKTFVDMPMKFDPSIVIQNFKNLPNHQNSTLKAFLAQNFNEAGSDILQWTPGDWKENPDFLNDIQDQTVRIPK